MHTLHSALACVSAAGATNSAGPLLSHWTPPQHHSSSHAPSRRLLPSAGSAHTTPHAALPRIGVVAVPDESLATARLPQQQQQQSAPAAVQRRVLSGRSRADHSLQDQEDVQQPTQLHQQLSALQQATQQQQAELWQAQQAFAAAGRQQAWPAQGHTSRLNGQSSPMRGASRGPADRQQFQPRQFQQQQTDRSYFQADHGAEAFQPQQQRWNTQQQRQGQGQGRAIQSCPQQQSFQQPQQFLQQSGPKRQGPSQLDSYQPRQQQDRRPTPRDGPPANTRKDSAANPAAADSTSSSQLRFNYGLRQDWSLPTGMAVTYLGSSSGAPTKDRNVSCTVLRLPEALYMVDCGEGSCRQVKLTGLQLEKVDALFITHLHGDHCFGIGTMLVALNKARNKAAAAAGSTSHSSSSSGAGGKLPGPDSRSALRVFGPPRVGELVSSMLFIAGVGRQLDQPVYITEFVETASEAHDWQPLLAPMAMSSAAGSRSPSCPAFIRRMAPTQELQQQDWPAGLSRRLDSTGLQWRENSRRSMSNWSAKAGLLWQIPCRDALVTAAQLQHRVPCWGYVFEERLQPAAGAANTTSSSSSSTGDVGADRPRGRRVVLLGDTVDSRAIAPIALGADLVSHEATFAAGMEGKAAQAQHSTAWMAGQFAWAIQAKALVLTHFSARYEGSRANSKWAPGGGAGVADRRPRAEDVASDAEAEERCIKALQREADDQYGLGPVLLAIDLLTAHVPKQEEAEE